MYKRQLAIVGPTGSGKSTTAALLRRFYDPVSGRILIDGHDLREISQDSIGDHIAMVLQDPFLFSGTIFENIRYANVIKNQLDIEKAASAVGAHESIMRLPGGYNFVLDQGGRNLSLGQRQLLSFARALVAVDEEHRHPLRQGGMLTRDPRKVERKKPGRPKARKRFQFSKR